MCLYAGYSTACHFSGAFAYKSHSVHSCCLVLIFFLCRHTNPSSYLCIFNPRKSGLTCVSHKFQVYLGYCCLVSGACFIVATWMRWGGEIFVWAGVSLRWKTGVFHDEVLPMRLKSKGHQGRRKRRNCKPSEKGVSRKKRPWSAKMLPNVRCLWKQKPWKNGSLKTGRWIPTWNWSGGSEKRLKGGSRGRYPKGLS